jgi:hypothetical protein
VPDNSQTTTTEAAISISESNPKPANATDRADTAAMANTTIPTTFQPSVMYSNAKPRRSSTERDAGLAKLTAPVWQPDHSYPRR